MFLLKLTTLILSATFLYGEEKFKKPNLGYTDIEKLKSGTEPFFEVWDEDNAVSYTHLTLPTNREV